MHAFGINLPEIADTLILIYNGQVYKKSAAWILIFQLLGKGWKTISIFKILPVKFRDACYDNIARNRYGWFGKRETCYFPTLETRELFLD